MKDIITGAQDKRYQAPEGEGDKNSILVSEAWI
jgi:hypothetical protein